MGPQQFLIFVEAGEEERMIVRQRGDALYRYPEIIPRHVAIPTAPAVAGERLGVPVPLANEQPGFERGLVINLVEASGKEAALFVLGKWRSPLPVPQRSGEIQPESSVSSGTPYRSSASVLSCLGLGPHRPTLAV